MVSVVSFNANGLRTGYRRQQALMVCEAGIICLQETHWDDGCVKELEREWMGEMFVNNGRDNSRGVAILVKRGVVENVRKCEDDGDGRAIGIIFEHMGKEFKLLNVYAPNEVKKRGEFFGRMGGMCGRDCIIVGDFNVWCGRLDATASMCFTSDSSRKVLKDVMIMNGLRDVWRDRNPRGRVFSRKQVVRGQLKQSRIDLVLGTVSIIGQIGTVGYTATTLSDHMALRFNIGHQCEKRGGGVWCLNGMLMKEEHYKGKVRDLIMRKKTERLYEEDMGKWWEEMKEELKNLSMSYSCGRGRREREKEKSLQRELAQEAERAEKGKGHELGRYLQIRAELEEMEQKRCMGAIVRSKAKYVVEGEKCSGFFLGLEKIKQKNNYLETVEGKDGEKITDFVGIVKRVEEFYRELFRKEEVDEESKEQVLEKIKTKINDEAREMSEGEIGTGEIKAAILGLGRNKSPGLDGLIGEFYIEFREELVPVLEKLFKWIEKEDVMPASISTGLISIIYKKGSRDRLENYRPLSCLNSDYKILAKVLANRIKRVIGTVVGSTQAYSIPGRDISDTISSIRDTIEHIKGGRGGIVMSIDLNKAFDRVDHGYLYGVLGRVGFGHRMVGWIQRMYNNAVSCVKINGLVTNSFRLERSVRQGCPLSALLYSLSAEPLASLLKGNKKIKGIDLPGGQISLIYQYADDTTVTVQDRESALEVLKNFDLYGRASGAKVNIEKSEIMYFGDNVGGRRYIGLKERKDCFKVLGVNLGIKAREGRDMQYEGILNSMKRTLGFWRLRGLKLKGKVVIANALIMSKLVYTMTVLDVPERVLKEAEKMVSDFLWGGKGVKIAREVLENEYKDGGLKLINLEKKRDAIRLKMMLRYIKDKTDHVWKVFLKEAINKCGECGDSGIFMELKKGMLKGVSEFYKEMLVAWGQFVTNMQFECKNVKQVWEQPLFLNPKITHEGSTIYNLAMWRAGFRKVRDVVYEYVPGFMRAQVVVDEVRGNGGEMWMGTAEGLMERIKNGMPEEWRRMIATEVMGNDEGDVEMKVGVGGGIANLKDITTRIVYQCLRAKVPRRPAGEEVWGRVLPDMDGKRIWLNLRVKWNSIECENFDFLLRHNRVFNNLIVSKFDESVNKQCDVCKVKVETCLHEFVECRELEMYFQKLKALISRCWTGEFVETMEWKELWLFGVVAKVKGCNINLLNYTLSHARFAVKLRRNIAHFEKREMAVWSVFQSIIKRDVKMLHGYIKEEEFQKGFLEGNTFILMKQEGGLLLDFA